MNKILFTAALLSGSLSIQAQTTAPKPYGALPTAQQLQWQKLQTYGFIHFGINTFTDKEWGYGDESPSLFNPSNFDAEQIVKTFKAGGFKGVIITAKHHDGFCLWPTKTTEHNITKSPFRNGKGDLVREVADACQKYGMKFGVYLSPWDRNTANYGTPEYVQMYRDQLTELLTNYGEVFETWHDGANGGDGYYNGARETRNIDRSTYYNWPSVWKMIEKLQPNAVIFGDIGKGVRWIGNERGMAGDPCWATFTPESVEPGKDPSNGTVKYWLSVNGTRNGQYWMPAETDFSIRPGWFWHQKENDKVKTAKELWYHYLISVGRGASMLLNIPPDKTGRIFKTDSLHIQQFGDYLKQVFSKNIIKNAKISSTNTRGNDAKFSTKNLMDGDEATYWAADDDAKNPSLTIELPKNQTFNLIQFKEFTPLGQRIDSVQVSAMINGKYEDIGGANSIGINKIIVLNQAISTNKLKINILKAEACPALSEIGLYFAPNTLDEKEAIASGYERQNKLRWKVVNSPLRSAIDNQLKSFYTARNKEFILSFGLTKSIQEVIYYPVNQLDGLASKYRLYVSDNKRDWTLVSEGEFSNIKANPIPQSIVLDKAVKARFLKLEATQLIEGERFKIAEISVK